MIPFESSLDIKGAWFPRITLDFKGACLSRIALNVLQNSL